MEINEKDLEKATGGGFSAPLQRDTSGGQPTDPEGCCGLFMAQNNESEAKCRNCYYVKQDWITGEYKCLNKRAQG